MVGLPLCWYSLQFYWQNKTKKLYKEVVKECPKKYIYALCDNKLEQSYYGVNEKDGEKLVKYYKDKLDYDDKVKLGIIEREIYRISDSGDTSFIEPIAIPVSIDNQFSIMEEVYCDYKTKQDSVVKIYSFDTDNWGYIEAYVPIFVLHDSLPSDSLLKDYLRYLECLPKEYKFYGTPSQYGFYCN